MQMRVDGMPACAAVSTVVWQYRQSRPSSPTWCLWLNGIGCATGWPTGSNERSTDMAQASRPAPNVAPPSSTSLTTSSARRLNTCGMRGSRSTRGPETDHGDDAEQERIEESSVGVDEMDTGWRGGHVRGPAMPAAAACRVVA